VGIGDITTKGDDMGHGRDGSEHRGRASGPDVELAHEIGHRVCSTLIEVRTDLYRIPEAYEELERVFRHIVDTCKAKRTGSRRPGQQSRGGMVAYSASVKNVTYKWCTDPKTGDSYWCVCWEETVGGVTKEYCEPA
jgi:hypothetical protein